MHETQRWKSGRLAGKKPGLIDPRHGDHHCIFDFLHALHGFADWFEKQKKKSRCSSHAFWIQKFDGTQSNEHAQGPI
jgi:hypothetical protein